MENLSFSSPKHAWLSRDQSVHAKIYLCKNQRLLMSETNKPSNSKTILVVEDNEMNLKLFKVVLRKLPNKLYIARDGEEAMEKIKTLDPDVIILDIGIPKIDGIEIAKWMCKQQKYKNTPIIAVTAYAMQGDKDEILQAGCDEYVSKPIDTHKFPETIKKYL